MSAERDELAKIMDEWLDDEAPLNLRRYIPVAASIFAAGYRKQPISPDELRTIRDDAWKRGYEACRKGKQNHSPYSPS